MTPIYSVQMVCQINSVLTVVFLNRFTEMYILLLATSRGKKMDKLLPYYLPEKFDKINTLVDKHLPYYLPEKFDKINTLVSPGATIKTLTCKSIKELEEVEAKEPKLVVTMAGLPRALRPGSQFAGSRPIATSQARGRYDSPVAGARRRRRPSAN